MLVGRCNIYRSNPSRIPSLERHFIPFFSSGDKTAIRRKRREMCATLSHVSQTIDLFKNRFPSFFAPKKMLTHGKEERFHWFRADIADGWRLSDNRTESKCQFQDRERQLDEPLQSR
jgi:hypothetical protein